MNSLVSIKGWINFYWWHKGWINFYRWHLLAPLHRHRRWYKDKHKYYSHRANRQKKPW